jgi:hypothetical protein
MQVRLGGEADEEELFSELWQKWCKVLTKPAARVYEFLVTQYCDGLEEVDLKVVAKHTNTSQNGLIKTGGILDELEGHGLVDKAEVE